MRSLLALIAMEVMYQKIEQHISRAEFYQYWHIHCPHINRVEVHWSDGCPDCTRSFCD